MIAGLVKKYIYDKGQHIYKISLITHLNVSILSKMSKL